MSDSSDAQQRIASEAMDLIDSIEAVYGTDFKLGAVAIIADVVCREGTVNPIVYQCSDPRRWLQSALLREALEVAEEQNERRVEEAGEPGEC